MNDLSKKLRDELSNNVLTLGELVGIAERENVPLSALVVTEAMVKESKTYNEVLKLVRTAFEHNLRASEVGLLGGQSFLLGQIGSDLIRQGDNALIEDAFINKALVYTLATEVGNHVIGLRPCAGTGDSCPYTGLLKALEETGYSEDQVGHAAALMLKVGSIFREGKKTTGCNMEGFGAGAAATAAALTDLRGGTARQVAKAIVLALSPTIAVPCTPRVMVSGLCATHISGAILIGNQASNLVLKTSIPVEVDVDVMIAMAARVHTETAPMVTAINLEYLGPFFKKEPQVDTFVDPDIVDSESTKAREAVKQAREEVRKLVATSRPLTQVLADVVVGGSSIAVGSPTNMARICHAMISGKIKKIDIDLTLDLFARRAINVPAILMGAIRGSKTDDAKMYHEILNLPEIKEIEITVNKIDAPEVQRIRIETTGISAMVDARNRGGGRVSIIDARPSLKDALNAAQKLGIEVVK
jgi:L-serine dehydratase